MKIIRTLDPVKYFLLAALLVYCLHSQAQIGWQNVGGANFAQSYIQNIAMAFGRNHTPYIAYNYYGPISVRKYTDGQWPLVGASNFTDSTTSYIGIAIAPDSMPYVTFQDEGDSGKASVMKFDGTNWSYVGARGFSIGYYTEINSPVIAVDSGGVPYVAYVHSGNPGSISVMKFDGTSWVYVGPPSIYSIGLAENPTIAFDPNNVPYVAFSGDRNGFSTYKANVMKFNGSAWVFAGDSAFSQSNMDMISLAFDRVGTPYVAYREYSPLHTLTVMKLTGSIWGAVGPMGFTSNAVSTPSIAIDTASTPYVAFTDYSYSLQASVMKYNGSWQYVGSPGFSTGYSWETTLAFDRDIPYVAFYDVGTDNGARVMKYDSVCAPAITSRSVYSSCGSDHSGLINFAAISSNLTYKIQSDSYTDSNTTGHFSGLVGGFYLETVSNGTCTAYGNYDFVLARDSAPAVTASFTSPWCLGGSLSLSASPAGYTYVWTGPNGGFTTTQADTIITIASVADTGTYSIVLIAPDGCTDTSYAHVRFTRPVLDTLPLTICHGQSYAGHNSNGRYNDTYTSAAGCDSIRTLLLTVTPEPQSTDSQTICHGQNYDGYMASGTYHDTYTVTGGCDSLRVLILTVLPDPVPVIIVRGDTLSGDTTGVTSYTWYRNGAVINNANGYIFIAGQDGYYQVEETKSNTCSNISDSVHVVHTGINKIQDIDFTFMTLSGNTFVARSDRFIDGYSIYTSCGQLLRSENTHANEIRIDIHDTAPGIYVLSIKAGGQPIIRRVAVME